MATGVQMMKGGRSAELQLYGDVGWDITPSAVAAALPKDSSLPLTVNLFSPGGDALAGLGVFDMLDRYDGKLTVRIDGVAASAGSLIAMAGDEILMPSNALMMIHKAWGGALGQASDLVKHAELLDQISANYRDTYAAKSGRTPEEIEEMMAATTWLTAEDAVANGFATKVIAAKKANASMPLLADGRFENPPEQLRKYWMAPIHRMTTDQPDHLEMTTGTSVTEPVLDAPQAAASGPAPIAPPAPTIAPEPAPSVSAEAALRREVSIRRYAAECRLSAEETQAHIDSGKPLEDVMLDVVKAFAQRVNAPAPDAGRHVPMVVSRDHGDTVRAAIKDNMRYRMSSGAVPQTDVGRQFQHRTCIDMLRAHLETCGQRTEHLSRNDIITYAFHSSSDFPLLFADVANKGLNDAYAEEPQTFKPFSRQRNLPDFKSMRDVQLQGNLKLTQTAEGGEYTAMTLVEAQATWRLATYTGKVIWTRQMIINDDLDGFSSLVEKAGRGARTTENDIAWALLTANSADALTGTAVFNAAGGKVNTIASANAIGITGINAGKMLMRAQRDIALNELNLSPAFLLVPSTLETAALQFLYPTGYAPAALTGASGPNPFAGAPAGASMGGVSPYAQGLQLIVEQRLERASAVLYYMVADPRRIDTLHYGYLAGEEGPTTTLVDKRDPDGAELLVRMDFAAALKDFRGFVRLSNS
jgi:ATP-dependent protease ClpP protease subunit